MMGPWRPKTSTNKGIVAATASLYCECVLIVTANRSSNKISFPRFSLGVRVLGRLLFGFGVGRRSLLSVLGRSAWRAFVFCLLSRFFGVLHLFCVSFMFRMQGVALNSVSVARATFSIGVMAVTTC
jgi:hypothetical protein